MRKIALNITTFSHILSRTAPIWFLSTETKYWNSGAGVEKSARELKTLQAIAIGLEYNDVKKATLSVSKSVLKYSQPCTSQYLNELKMS